MGALSEFGKLGLTSIGSSPDEAESIYQQVEASLDAETAPKAQKPPSWHHFSQIPPSTPPLR